MQRYLELDGMRGIAALMVVIYHFSVRYGQIYPGTTEPAFMFALGESGVHLFLLLSGFVIFLTLNKTTYAVDFLMSRFSRLYPAYWVAVILTFSVLRIFASDRQVDFTAALVNLTMLQSWLGFKHVDGVYWTLSLELAFYGVMYLLFITKQMQRIEMIAVVWLAGMFVVQYLVANKLIQVHPIVELTLLLGHGNLLFAGIMFYKIMHRTRKISSLTYYLRYVVLSMAVMLEYYLRGYFATETWGYFLIFLLFTEGHLKVFSWKPLVFLGTISYSLYLIHQNIGYVMIQQMESYNIANSVSIILVPSVVSIVIASLIQQYVEKPSLDWMRTRWKQSRLRQYMTQGAPTNP